MGVSLASLVHLIRHRIVAPLLPGFVLQDINRNDKTGVLFRAWGHVFANHLAGGYYEFGVYQGDSFRASVHAYRTIARWYRAQLRSQEGWRRTTARIALDQSRPFYAFDTFAGMPDNDEGVAVWSPGFVACSLGEFRRRNHQAGIVESDTIRYVEGDFADVLRNQATLLGSLVPAAIVNIDCDLYKSACSALAIIAPKLRQGTVLLMDDWNGFHAAPDRGERRALHEFLAQHPDITMEPWFSYAYMGQAFLVHVRPSR